KATPSNWSTNSLEDYDQYHFRFLSIGCHKKRDQEDFFKECCHPRQKNETLENIPADADYAAKAKADSDAALKAKADEETASKAAEAAKAKTDADAALRAKADADAASKAKSEADVAKAQSESSSSNSDTSNSATASNALSSVLHAYGTNGDSKGTFFYQGGAAGACGTVNSDSTPLVALPTSMYEGGKHCGKSVMIKNTANGKTVQAKVMDMCPGCPTATSLDLSVGAYDQIGDQATGVLPIVWGFM
ncbi:RlpA-like double-psi beta-barrel-protein domain-containing protein-containing protein, partial [Phakopsora pachyrhizi]